MKAVIVFAAIVAVAWSQGEVPIPYSFNYVSNTEDGGAGSHQESGDGAGRVSGSYSVTNLEGHNRVVEYIADENGFRATIRTNEPGTANINPADVVVESSAPEAASAPTYALGISGPAPTAPRVIPGPARARPASSRYVLVPVTD